jgi:hypothetical protein
MEKDYHGYLQGYDLPGPSNSSIVMLEQRFNRDNSLQSAQSLRASSCLPHQEEQRLTLYMATELKYIR